MRIDEDKDIVCQQTWNDYKGRVREVVRIHAIFWVIVGLWGLVLCFYLYLIDYPTPQWFG